MTPRERVTAALNHQEPDRVPIDLGQAAGDGIVNVAYSNLLEHLGLGARPERISKMDVQIVHVDEDVLRRFSVDFRAVRLGAPDRSPNRILPGQRYEDEWGVIRTKPPGGYYYDVTYNPLGEDGTISGLDRFRWPDPDDPGRYRGLREKARRIREETDYAVVLDVDCSFFLVVPPLRGWENFYTDLLVNVEFVESLMDRIIDIRLAIAERALAEAGEFADVIIFSRDDLGSKYSTLVSRKLYRSMIWPRQKRVVDFFKARTPAKLFYHNDGAIYPLLGDLVELGVDIINPVEVTADGMEDTARLKAEYGDRLTFWGGIDTREVLPHGTPEDVRREVRLRVRDLGRDGGYVLCSVHNIQPDVPPRNVVAMFDEAAQVGGVE